MPRSVFFRLSDLLRRERELDAVEVHALLSGLPGRLDALPEWWRYPAPLLARLEIVGGSAELLNVPVRHWPPVELRLADDTATEPAIETTVSYDLTLGPRALAPDAAACLGVLIYELLGAVASRRGGLSFSPSPGLNEAANAVLARALAGGGFPNCAMLWKAWSESLEPEQRRLPAGMMRWQHPANERPEASAGMRLTLTPSGKDVPPLRIVAGDKFRLGRSRSLSDLPLHVWEKGAFSAERTQKVSRVHALWDPAKGGFLDGDGTRPSSNGTLFCGEPLTSTVPVAPSGTVPMVLGGEYLLEVVSLPWVATWPWPVAGANTSLSAKASGPAQLFFLLPEDEPVLREALWMRQEVGFTLAPDGRFRWTADPCKSVGWFVHRRGSFVIANHHLPAAGLVVSGARLKPGELLPLTHGDVLEVQGVPWSVTIHA